LAAENAAKAQKKETKKGDAPVVEKVEEKHFTKSFD
jgi:hypothetical protein